MRNYLMIFCVAMLICSTNIYSNFINNEISKRDYVPDAETAIKVAEAIWLPIYGQSIYQEKPFTARLKNGNVWIVEGTLKNEKDTTKGTIHLVVGGVAYIEIQKEDCRILNVSHGK